MKKILNIIVLITFILCIDNINAYTEYKIGDEVTYNNMYFYVIENSDSSKDTVTMLKAEPLTVDEVILYSGVGTDNNTVDDYKGYGNIAYYSSPTCGVYDSKGCVTDYESSNIKHVVDTWALSQAPDAIETRLISYADLTENLGYENKYSPWIKAERVPSWVYSYNYWYWTMNSYYNDSEPCVWTVTIGGSNLYCSFITNRSAVRPVITLSKTILEDEDESVIDDIDENQNEKDYNVDDDKQDKEVDNTNTLLDNYKSNSNSNINTNSTKVKVENTYMSRSIIVIIIGFIIASISVLIMYKLSNKKR